MTVAHAWVTQTLYERNEWLEVLDESFDLCCHLGDTLSERKYSKSSHEKPLHYHIESVCTLSREVLLDIEFTDGTGIFAITLERLCAFKRDNKCTKY